MQFYTDEQVAAMLNVTARTVADERRKKRLNFRKIGRHIRITDADVTRYLNEVSQCPEEKNTESTGTPPEPETNEAPSSTFSGLNVVDLSVSQRALKAGRKRRNSKQYLS